LVAARTDWGVNTTYTGNGSLTDSYNVGIPSAPSPPNTNRRYVVDEVSGSANVLCTFQTMPNATDSHEVRLVGGKLRCIHTITVIRPGHASPVRIRRVPRVRQDRDKT